MREIQRLIRLLGNWQLSAEARRRWGFVGVAAVFAVSGLALALRVPTPSSQASDGAGYLAQVGAQYDTLAQAVNQFEDRQQQEQAQVVPDQDLQRRLSQVQMDVAGGQFREAGTEMKQLRAALVGWNQELDGRKAAVGGGPVVVAGMGMLIPILLYHYTPANFDQQLTHLEQAGYAVVDLDQALAGLQGGPLPSKPVVITFDDGFANQMEAFHLLQRHHMKATFYIINGGAGSRWCIGAGRRYGDPLQPASGCGDAYLNWDQVRQLDRSGLITIGGHTLDHENLAGLSPEEQRRQIVDSKSQLEAVLGHGIRHFAYPYGAYNQTTIDVVRQAGYVTAVTTLPGTYQDPGSPYTLKRVRDAMVLP